jgi:hypothetical protein
VFDAQGRLVNEVHAYEMYLHEMHARKMHAHEMHGREVHAHETHTYEIHDHKMHAREVQASSYAICRDLSLQKMSFDAKRLKVPIPLRRRKPSSASHRCMFVN